MKILLLSYIFISVSFTSLCANLPNILDFGVGLRIANKYNSDNKGLCIFSSDHISTQSEHDYFMRVFSDEMSKNSDYDDTSAEEHLSYIIANYFKFRQDRGKYTGLLIKRLMPNQCSLATMEENALPSLVISKLTSERTNLQIETLDEFLALVCEAHTLYKKLHAYSDSENRNLQQLSDISVKNDAIIRSIVSPNDEINYHLLVEETQEFMATIDSTLQPTFSVTSCLVAKSIISDRQNALEVIKNGYIQIVKILDNGESCEVSTLSDNRRGVILNLLKSVNGLESDQVQRERILKGLGNLFSRMKYTNVYFYIDTINNFKYINQYCQFQRDKLMADYEENIKDLRRLATTGNVESVLTHCIISNVRNYRFQLDREVDRILFRVIHLNIIINHLLVWDNHRTEYDSNIKMMLNYVRRDSRPFDLFLRDSYLNQLINKCRLMKLSTDYRFYFFTRRFNEYMYDYMFQYCTYQSTDAQLFTDNISQRLLDIKNHTVTTLHFMKSITEKFLDQSDDSMHVSWLDQLNFETDSCQVGSNIDYHRIIQFERAVVERPGHTDYNFLHRATIPVCARLKSTAKFVLEYNKHPSVHIWTLIIESYLYATKNKLYTSLSDLEKLNSIKNHFDVHYQGSQGIQKRVECEIKNIVKHGWLHLSQSSIEKFYLYLAVEFPNPQCLLDPSMFSIANRHVLVSHLRLHPDFSDIDEYKGVAYVKYMQKSIPSVLTGLRSNDYLPDVIPKIVDDVSCSCYKSSTQLNKIISLHLEAQLSLQQESRSNYIEFHLCLLSKEISSYISEPRNQHLSPQETNDINNLYQIIITANQNLRERNEANFNAIFELIKIKEEFKQFNSNKYKLSMAKCQIKKLHSIRNDQSSSQSSEQTSSTRTIEQAAKSIEKLPGTSVEKLSHETIVVKPSEKNSEAFILDDNESIKSKVQQVSIDSFSKFPSIENYRNESLNL